MPVLSVENLTKIFDGATPYVAVDDVSFTVNAGEILGILGPNGAGKTTTINMLLSTLTPTYGSINYFGKSLAQARQEILMHVGYASTYERMPNRLSVYENLAVFARLYGVPSNQIQERIKKFLLFFGMWDIRNQEQMTLSAGQYARVALAKAFLIKPKIALLDEPSAALDPDIAHEMRNFILAEQRDNGMAIILASHNMDEVSMICDNVLVLQKGKILAHDTPEVLAASVSKTRLRLLVASEFTNVLNTLLADKHVFYTTEKNNYIINVDEEDIANFLMMLADNKIAYTSIAIEQPTLEDYFLNVAKQSSVKHL